MIQRADKEVVRPTGRATALGLYVESVEVSKRCRNTVLSKDEGLESVHFA